MIRTLIGLGAIFAAYANNYKDFHFLAAGRTLEKLKHAQTGYDQQRAVRQDVTKYLGAKRVSLANDTELFVGWPEFKSSGGFKVYFEKNTQPEGWHRPEKWGERQTNWNDWIYLPETGSEHQAFLLQQADRLESIYKTYGHPARYKDYADGWFSWERDIFPKEDGFVYSKHIIEDVYVITVRDFISKAVPDYVPEGCLKISASDAKMLENNPAKAKARADNIRHGSSFRNFGAGLFDRMGL